MKTAAILSIFDAARMNYRGRKSIATWLHRQARLLMKKHKKLDARFTARYNYRDVA